MKKKINNKLTFVTAILNLVASLMCAGTLIWGRISIEAGYFFFDKLEGLDALGAAIVFVVLLIILVPMSIQKTQKLQKNSIFISNFNFLERI